MAPGGTYTLQFDPDVPGPGKRCSQKIERKPLMPRARITRFIRKTIGFSQATQMHVSSLTCWSIAPLWDGQCQGGPHRCENTIPSL